jgi:glycosyltransferase involved in cell wall biosynthesis
VRIALASDWYLPRLGGIELHLGDLARRLVEAGHEVVVLTSTPASDGAGQLASPEGVRVVRLDARRLPVAGVVASPSVLSEIAAVLERERSDLLHSHVSIVSPVGYGAAWSARRLGLPVVTTFHSVIRGLRPVLRVLDRTIGFSGWGTIVTAVSSRVAREVAPLSGDAPVLLLPNGIDAAAWRVEEQPVRGASTGSSLRLVSAMRLVSKKRPAALLRMVHRVAGELGAGSVHLSLAGDGAERQRLERMIDRLGLAGSVTLLGRVDRAQLRSLYAEADLFVLPTRLEAFGLAALEARAAGLPVAAMRGTGVEDFIEDEREGWLASDDSTMSDIVSRLARDRAPLDAVAAHNRSVPARNDWKEVLPRHLELYAETARGARQVPD